MVLQCREYLVEKLKAAGIHQQPFTSYKKLEVSASTRIGAVLFAEETYERSGKKVRYSGEQGAAQKRTKVFTRTANFSVVIGDPSPVKTEELLSLFLCQLDRGIYFDGNYTAIEVESAEWVDEDDSILKSRVAVNVKIKFIGGLYRDSKLVPVTGVEVIDARKEIDNHGDKDENGSSG